MRNLNSFIAITLVLTLLLTLTIGCEPAVEEPAEPAEPEEPEEPEEVEEAVPHVVAAVSSHYLATEAGIEIMEAGGTAADAAVAVAAVMSVVEPFFSSVLGGGTWALYYNAETVQITSLDGVGPVGSNATVEDYDQRGGQFGMHQSVVPGAWDGWMIWLEEYGALDLGEILAPAIAIAREGHAVSGTLDSWINIRSDQIAARPDAVAIYMPEGSFLQQGDTIYQYDLADTLEALVSEYDSMIDEGRSEALQAARDYYYRGPLAEAIVAFSDEGGGYLTIEDFNGFTAEIVNPISIQYSDELEVFQNPPNSQGINMLLALNILKGYDMSQYGPDDAEAVHLQAEALKLAFADLHYLIGDPRRMEVSVDELLSDQYADNQRERISMDAVIEWPTSDGLSFEPIDGDTTTFHIADQHGNIASVTTSLGAEFMVVGDTGIHINNRMRMISTEEGIPNQLTPGYKVRHTSNPYMVLKNGKPYISGGNTGADVQTQAQVQQFMHIVEFGLSAQEAVARPRFSTTAMPSLTFPYQIGNQLLMHRDFPEELINELRAMGHDAVINGIIGSGNVIIISEDGLNAEYGAEPLDDASHGIVIPAED